LQPSPRPPAEQMPPQRQPKVPSEQVVTRKPSNNRSNQSSASSKKTATSGPVASKPDKGGALDSPPSNLPYAVDHRLPTEEVMEQPMSAQTSKTKTNKRILNFYQSCFLVNLDIKDVVMSS